MPRAEHSHYDPNNGLKTSRLSTPRLRLIRGLPGCGKTVMATYYVMNNSATVSLSIDDFFVDADGQYRYDHRFNKEASEHCRARTEEALRAGTSVVVHNPFIRKIDTIPYRNLAHRLGVQVDVVDLFDVGLSDIELATRNVHNVPRSTIEYMRNRYEHEFQSSRGQILFA